MIDPEVIDALRELAHAAHVSESTLVRVAETCRQVTLTDGAVLFREGEVSSRAYFVREGSVALQINAPPHGATRLLTLGPGELVGWSPFLGAGAMTATAAAVGDVTLLEVDAVALRVLLESEPRAGYEIMRWVASALAKRLTATRLQLLDIYHDEAPRIPEARNDAGSAS